MDQNESLYTEKGFGVSRMGTRYMVIDLGGMFHSNMTWFFSPIKSTDTDSALFRDISALAHWQ